MDTLTIKTQFEKDIYKGLTSFPKKIPSRYFYDDEGSRIFQQIMDLEEYYPTRCEFEIINHQKEKFLNHFQNFTNRFNLIELGAGDGKKTKILLKYFKEQKARFTYYPIDISKEIIDDLENTLKNEIPGLNVEGIHDEYFNALTRLKQNKENNNDDTKNIILFLGGNIGNFSNEKATEFLTFLQNHLNQDDLLVIGFDMKKNPEIIRKAYNDDKGITRQFNMNLLNRLNRELEADFNLENFMHYPVYDPENAEARSYLVSKCAQNVNLKKIDLTINFDAWEVIHTEISRKYDFKHIEKLAENSGFEVIQNLTDSADYYTNSIWKLK